MTQSEKPPTRISKRIVDALPSGAAVWDSQIKGFGVRRQRRDASFVLKFSLAGRQRFITIGRHGPLTADEARKAAKKLVGQIASGIDPSREARLPVTALTVGELCERYLLEGRMYKPNKKESSWSTDRSNIERHIKPVLGHLALDHFADRDVIEFLAKVTDGGTRADLRTVGRGRAIVRGGSGTAARSLAVLSSVLNFGIRLGALRTNVTRHVRAAKGRQPGRFLSHEEWDRLGATLRDARNRGVNPAYLDCIRLLALTGARRSEITRLRWEHIDFVASSLNLPDSKVGARTIPLGSHALSLLQELAGPGENGWVFPSSRGTGPVVGVQKVWSEIRTRANLLGVRLHDLRHSFASEAVNSGASLYLTGALLGHRQPRTTQRYAHLQNDPVRQAATTASEAINKALSR